MCALSFQGFIFQAEDGIRDVVRSRVIGDLYMGQNLSGVLRVRSLMPVTSHDGVAPCP